NTTLYALAGIESTANPDAPFTAYAMGIVRGVAALAGSSASDVFIPIDVRLEHALTLGVEGPRPTRRGPNLLRANLAIRVGSDGYALLPGGAREGLLGAMQSFEFVGVPQLV